MLTQQGAFRIVCLVLAAQFSQVAGAQSYEEAVDGIAARVAETMTGQGEGSRTVAVVDFTDVQGEKTELGRFLAEELSVALLNTRRGLRIVDRVHLKRLFEEHRLGEDGSIDPQTAREVGRIAGVHFLVTGTLTPLDEGVRLTVKVLETETADIVAGDRVTIPATDQLRSLVNRGLAPGNEGGSTSTYTKAYNVESREAGGLRVTARSVRVLEEGRAAALFELTNTSPLPLTVYIADTDSNSSAYDDLGNYLPQYRGLPDSDGCVVGYGGSDGLYIEPGETQQITEVYRGDSDAQLGSRFTLKLHLRLCRGETRHIPLNRKGSGDEAGRAVQFSFADIPADKV